MGLSRLVSYHCFELLDLAVGAELHVVSLVPSSWVAPGTSSPCLYLHTVLRTVLNLHDYLLGSMNPTFLILPFQS